jgi:hypothetical protein
MKVKFPLPGKGLNFTSASFRVGAASFVASNRAGVPSSFRMGDVAASSSSGARGPSGTAGAPVVTAAATIVTVSSVPVTTVSRNGLDTAASVGAASAVSAAID